MSEAIRFHFDFISPYAYVAWFLVERVAERHGRELVPVPVLFAGLLRAHGTKGPAEVPAKRDYVFKDAYRKAAKAGLGPLVPPPAHPFNPLVALRAAHVVTDPPSRSRLITALFRAVWAGGAGVEEPGLVADIARSVGLDGEQLTLRAQDAGAKDALRTATEEAIAKGVFGVPTVSVGAELFWGVDALEALDDFLAGNDPLPRDALARWTAVPATTQRKY